MGPIGVALISNSVIAVVLCGVGEVVWRSKRPALAHAIWVLALVKLLTPPVWHVWLPSPSVPASAMVVSQSIPTMSAPITSRETVQPAERIMVSSNVNLSPAPISNRALIPSQSHWNVTDILLLVWLCGSAGLLVIGSARARGFRRILDGAESASREVNREIWKMAERLAIRHVPEARIVQGTVPPMIWFMGGRSLILFPRAVLQMEPDKRAAIVAHELAHLRRGDQWVRLLEMLATVALWWHPLVWLARWRLREAEEEACDAWVVWAMPQGRKSYAGVLVEMVRVISGPVPAGASGFGGFGHLQRRLVMILEKTPQRSLGIGGWVILGLLATSLPLAMAQGNGAAPVPARQQAENPASTDVTSVAVKGLLDATVNADPRLQQTATASIMTFGPKAIPVLVKGMKDPATVQTARILLTSFGRDAVDPLIAVLNGTDQSQRFLALLTLEDIASGMCATYGPRSGMPPMGGGLGGYAAPPPYNAEGLLEPGYRGAPAPFGAPAAIPAPYSRAIDPAIQQALGKIEMAIAKATTDSDLAIRRRAASFLGNLAAYAKDNSVIDRLIDLASDDDVQIRQAAVESLGNLGPKGSKAVPVLMTAAIDREKIVRVAAILALGNIGPDAKDAMATLVHALKDSNPQVRLAAASALGRMNRAEGQ